MTPLRIALAVSLAFNLFLGGLLAGEVLRPHGVGIGPGGVPRPFTLSDRLAQDISPEGYAQIKTQVADIDAVMFKGFTDRDAQFQQLRGIAEKEPFDAAAFEALLMALPNQRLDNERKQWQAIGDLFAKATPADRRVLANTFFRRPGGLGGPNGPGHPGGPDGQRRQRPR
jgi:hypothetical protein